MIAAELPPQACTVIQIKRSAFGFAVGDPVRAGMIDARIAAFTCDGYYAPAAWLLIDGTPGNIMRWRLADLVKRGAAAE